MSDKSMIFIHGFGTDYVPEYVPAPKVTVGNKTVEGRVATGKMKPRDWVEYSPLGSVQRTVIREWIELLKPAPLTGKGGDNPANIMANARWAAIEPRYNAWKAGQELPIDGTPLAAWTGASRQQVEILKTHGVRTVEELSLLTDAHKTSIGIMGLGNLIEGAKRFILALDKTSVTKELEKKDQQIADLQAQMAELVEMVKEARAAPKTDAPKRRGRPPKHEQPAAA